MNTTMQAPEQKILAWHILPGDMRLIHDDGREVRIGETLSVSGHIACCPKATLGEAGLHACERAVDALRYRPNRVKLCFTRVEVWGDVVRDDDKLAGRYRRVLWIVPPEKTLRVLVEWAMLCAKKALERERAAGREPDVRSWNALEAIQRWLDWQIGIEELTDAAARAASAAYAAASAAYAAADAAASAAYAAADAAADAAYAAARAAAYAAYAAADAAADAAYAAARAAADDAADDAAYAARAENSQLLAQLLEANAVYEVQE